MLQVAAKEAVVVYSSKEGTSTVQRRIEYGPTLFMPRPGEWLHTFAWHSSEGGSQGVRKVPEGLVFQKLWLMPDQMYHDVPDVRTADDAVLTIRLMIFFELLDIATMLETTHDPIGDFVNAATCDVVDFTGRHDFESFKRNTDKLNELETYRQLTGPGGAVRLPDQQGGLPRLRCARAAPADARPGHRGADQAAARARHRAAGPGPGELQARQPDAPRRQAASASRPRRSRTSSSWRSTKQEAELRDREARQAFERQQGQLEADLRQRAPEPARRPAARASGGTAWPGRRPDRLPDPGPRRPRHRAPRRRRERLTSTSTPPGRRMGRRGLGAERLVQ